MSAAAAEIEKQIRNLRKKITAIEDLEKKQKKEKLNDDQKLKIKKKSKVVDEIAALKKKLQDMKGGAPADSAAAEDPAGPAAATEPEISKKPANGNGTQAPRAPTPPPEPKEDLLEKKQAEIRAAYDKEIMKLEKKVKDIQTLKEKQKEGQELNADQKAKMKQLKKFQDELHKQKVHLDKELAAAKEAAAPGPAAAAEEPEKEEEEDEVDPLKVDRTKLMALYKEFDAANDVARKIAMGRIKNPTVIQKNKASQVKLLQAAVDKEEQRIQDEEARLRKEAGVPSPSSEPQAAPEAEPEPEKELTAKEKKLAELEDRKKAAAADEDFELAAKLKAEIKKVQDMDDDLTVPEPAAAEEEEKEAGKEAAKPEEDEAPAAEEQTPAAAEEEEASAEAPEEPTEEEKEKAAAAAKEAEEAAAAAAAAEEEERKKAERPATPPPPPKPKTAEELGISFVRAKPKKDEADTLDLDDDDDTGAPAMTFDEMMNLKSKRKQAKEPYPRTFGAAPAPKTTRAPGAGSKDGILAKQAAKRLLADLRDLHESPLYTVRSETASDDLFTWHVNISPVEGPYAGFTIHFVVWFPDAYPLEPPTVRCSVGIAHPCVLSSGRQLTNEVCLHVNERTDPKPSNDFRGWCPAYTARTVLSHLASMFDKSYFSEVKREQLDRDRLAVMEYHCRDTGHCLENPYPSLPMFNGPFDGGMHEVFARERGCVWVGECTDAGHYWLHNFSGAGKHYFRCVLRYRGAAPGDASWALGYTTPEGGLLTPGSCPHSWFYYPAIGELRHNGQTTKVDVTAGCGDVVDCWLDLNKGEVSFSVNGVDVAEKLTAGITAEAVYHPSFNFGGHCGGELIFVANAEELPPSSLPIASVSSLSDATPACVVTKDTADETILGLGLAVDRESGAITSITPEADFLSQDAFVKGNVRKSLRESKPLSAFLPLMLGPHHAAKARPLLEKSMAEILRNPRAALPVHYTPPFKAANVTLVLPRILEGVVDTLVPKLKNLMDYDIQRAVTTWSHLHHAYLTLAATHPNVVEDGEKLLAAMAADPDTAAPHALALTVCGNGPFRPLLSALLAAELAKADSLEAAFKGQRKARVQKLLLLDSLRRLSAAVSLEDATSLQGRPTPDQVESFRKTCTSIARAKSVKDACASAGVDISEDDLTAMVEA
ncbi:Ubiquitin-conjugating enzyme E2 10 [Diplonema papillatum]|nr:Ubiquitin-conjugating enzyme E2 10 [Diplonema papillatum]